MKINYYLLFILFFGIQFAVMGQNSARPRLPPSQAYGGRGCK